MPTAGPGKDVANFVRDKVSTLIGTAIFQPNGRRAKYYQNAGLETKMLLAGILQISPEQNVG